MQCDYYTFRAPSMNAKIFSLKHVIRSPIGIASLLVAISPYLERSIVCKLIVTGPDYCCNIFNFITRNCYYYHFQYLSTRCRNVCISRFYFTVISLHGNNCRTISFIQILLLLLLVCTSLYFIF